MRYNTRYRYTTFNPSGFLPLGVKWLLISNVAVFLLMYLTSGTALKEGVCFATSQSPNETWYTQP